MKNGQFGHSGIQKGNYTVLLAFCEELLSCSQKRKEPMKKRLLSVGSLLMVSSVVTSAALAAFLPSSSFSGMEFRTSDLSLMVDPDYFGPGDFRVEHFLPGAFGLHPGGEVFTDDFSVKNASNQGQALKVTAQLTPGDQDWNEIKDVVTLSIFSHDNGQSTAAYTLEEWSTAAKELPKSHFNANSVQGYQLRYQMLENYAIDPDNNGPLQMGDPIGNEMMNKVSDNAVLVLLGEPTESL